MAADEAIELTRQFGEAMVVGDVVALEALLATGFTYTHSSARVEPREELARTVERPNAFESHFSAVWVDAVGAPRLAVYPSTRLADA
jgi:hypothetical protein